MVNVDDVRTIPALSPLFADGYSVAAIYTYTSLQGEALYWRVRLEHPTKGKQIRPIHLAAGDVLEIGEPHHEGNHNSKPLYGLHLLTQGARACAWIVEGEKCADAMNAAFARWGVQSEHIALTSGSATSAEKADWQPLQGSAAIIWPDNDDEGQAYAEAVTSKLAALDCAVDCIAPDALELHAKGDCVDWFDANPGATLADLLALPKQQPLQPDHDMEVICMSDIEIKPIDWLWPDRIACGKLTVIAGNPGLGKSQLTASLAAIVSTGRGWPDTLKPAPLGNIVFLSAEDDPADTIKPRLIAAGADVDRCHIIKAIRTKTKEGKDSIRTFDLTLDIERLGHAIARIGNVKLVIIDPFSAYLGETDSHNNAEVRGLLAPLSDMAAAHGVAILLVTHLNKSSSQDMIGRVIGSVGLIAAARAGYAVVKDEKTPETRYFVPIKNNVGNDTDGFAFQIEEVMLEEGIQTSRIIWQEGMVNAHAVLYPSPEEKPTVTNAATAFLRELLEGKSMLASDIFAEGEAAGYSKSSIQRAKHKLGVTHRKLGMKGGFEWSLPKTDLYGQPVEDAEDVEGTEDTSILEAASSQTELQSS
jgi:putative DNA primase/helicase